MRFHKSLHTLLWNLHIPSSQIIGNLDYCGFYDFYTHKYDYINKYYHLCPYFDLISSIHNYYLCPQFNNGGILFKGVLLYTPNF